MRLIDIFDKEVECDYRNEHYSVRDNGAVLRHKKEGMCARPLDDVWTFGSFDTKTGYMFVSKERVHRIVATAFHGPDVSNKLEVDHIDTNRQNNRPENLRWVTKLENILLNPITIKKLELACGCSIEEILKDLSILQDKNLEPNISWMRSVSKEESQKTLERWQKWMKEGTAKRKSPLNYSAFIRDPHYIATYPLEPIDLSLDSYDKALKNGSLFYFRKHMFGDDSVHHHYIIHHYYDVEMNIIYVFSKSNDDVKPFHLEEITIGKDCFLYKKNGFLSVAEMDKYFSLLNDDE